MTTWAKEGFSFDDVLLVPQYSELLSRKEADISTELSPRLKLKLPILSANMDSITWTGMSLAMHESGGAGVLHRYATEGEVLKVVHDLVKSGAPAIASIGVQGDDRSKAISYITSGKTTAICIDIAHGHSLAMIETIKRVRDIDSTVDIIAGNVATLEAATLLAAAGANILKVGIGPGSMCTSRIVTGHGVPQLSAIFDCAKVKEDLRFKNLKIVADGGIRNSGDIVKALAAGADAVMIGSLLAGTNEACLPTQYRGMASAEAQYDFSKRISNDAPEGVSKKLSPKGPVSRVLAELAGGIRSGFSYSGVRTLKELQENAVFQRISTNTVRENVAHGA